jgi:hypothetical protein
MPGARRTRSLACRKQNTRVSHHGYTENTRHSRTRMVLTVSFVLSPVTGLSCHRRLAGRPAKLDASVGASGPHDFAVRLGAIRQERRRVHRIPHPTSVTIAIRPSCEAGCAKDAGDLGLRPSEIFFTAGLDDPNQIERLKEIGFLAQTQSPDLGDEGKEFYSAGRRVRFSPSSRVGHRAHLQTDAGLRLQDADDGQQIFGGGIA